MNTRHAVLALLGWYLMVPTDLSQSPPISGWEHYGSYDTAKECDSAKDQLEADAVNDERANGCLINVVPSSSAHCAYEFARENAHCFATDDPRLKGK